MTSFRSLLKHHMSREGSLMLHKSVHSVVHHTYSFSCFNFLSTPSYSYTKTKNTPDKFILHLFY